METRLMVGAEMDMLYIRNPHVRFFKSFHQLCIKDVLGQLQCCEMESESCGRNLMGNW